MKNMNVFLSTLFRWQPCRETLTALVAGALVIALSAAMLLFKEIPWAGIAVRDMGQIFLLGILFPITTIQRAGGNWAGFGLHFKKWPVFLSVNLFLGALLFLLFLSESPPPPEFALNPIRIWTALYVMLALCFELVFFYAFLRTRLERAFGIVPAIILNRRVLCLSSHRVPTGIRQTDFCRPAVRRHISGGKQRPVDFPVLPGSRWTL